MQDNTFASIDARWSSLPLLALGTLEDDKVNGTVVECAEDLLQIAMVREVIS